MILYKVWNQIKRVLMYKSKCNRYSLATSLMETGIQINKQSLTKKLAVMGNDSLSPFPCTLALPPTSHQTPSHPVPAESSISRPEEPHVLESHPQSAVPLFSISLVEKQCMRQSKYMLSFCKLMMSRVL